MHELSILIKEDMKPALGVTEPGAIAFAVAKAREILKGDVQNICLRLNSGMYKNAYTCGIPNSEFFGNEYAAALGAIAGKSELALECLAEVDPEDNQVAEQWVKEGRIKVEITEMSPDIFIQAILQSSNDEVSVTIQDTHTHITEIRQGDKVLFSQERIKRSEEGGPALIHKYSLAEILNYCKTVPLEEIDFVAAAYKMNYELFELGLESPRTRFSRYLFEQNEGVVFSTDEEKTASLLCNTAIEARVLGLNKPAMSITGSGAHGIITTLPLYAVAKIRNLSDEELYRATMLSYLVCTYIKEYSGRLSAFCGCAIAGGAGMSLGLVLLFGGGLREMEYCLNGMAGSITGMVCDGGNQGCTMKGVVAVSTAFQSAHMAMHKVYLDPIHGVVGMSPEDTMRQMGRVASPGMVQTESTIVDIISEKKKIELNY